MSPITLLAFAALKLESVPAQIYAEEKTPVLFTLKAPPRSWQLVKVDTETGAVAQYLGPMNDQRIMGDQRAGDGIYTRKIDIQATGRTSRLSYAAVDGDDPRSKPTQIAVVSVELRPTLPQLMSQVWRRITARVDRPDETPIEKR
jgi:hypothetical protein